MSGARHYRDQSKREISKNVEVKAVFNEIGHHGTVVSVQKFYQLIDYYKLNLTTPVVSTDYISGDYRKTIAGDNTIYIKKNRIKQIQVNDYPVKINIKKEEPVDEQEYKKNANILTMIRNKTRYTVEFPDHSSKLDLTRVITTVNNQNIITYEIELELLSDKYLLNQSVVNFGSDSKSLANAPPTNSYEARKQPLDYFLENINSVLLVLLETKNLYTISERIHLTNWFNKYFATSNKVPGRLNEDLIVKTRNLKKKDMQYGGLVGNTETYYSITPKADGYQKLLIVHTIGVWLASSSDINLVYKIDPKITENVNIQMLFGFVIIGELIPTHSRLVGAPNSEYWFLAFDTINWNPKYEDTRKASKTIQGKVIDKGSLDIYINKRIQNAPRSERQNNVCSIVASRINDNINLLTITLKIFVPFKSVNEYYDAVLKVTSDTTRNYRTDGYIFTPELAPFNPESDKFPLRKRNLLKYPDVCKWKPKEDLTIDFMKLTSNGVIKLYSGRPKRYSEYGHLNDNVAIGFGFPAFDRENKEFNQSAEFNYKEFTGSDINPFDAKISLDKTNLDTVPDGSTGEFEYKGNKLVFRKLREKHPNTYEVADDVWGDIHRPITIETLRGETGDLVFYYHNNIKRNLFFGDKPKGKTLIDIGAGRGGSVHNYKDYDKILAVEPDSTNLQQLESRISTANIGQKVRTLNVGGENVDSITQNAKEWLSGPADTIVMMLSLSFFFQPGNMLDNLMAMISRNLKVGGSFLFLTIDGTVVREIFQPSLLHRSPYQRKRIEGICLNLKYIAEIC